MEEVKIEQNDLDQIKMIKTEYQNKVIEFGELKMTKIVTSQTWQNLLKQEEELEKEVVLIQEKEKQISDQIQKKYGSGNLNLETGILTKV